MRMVLAAVFLSVVAMRATHAQQIDLQIVDTEAAASGQVDVSIVCTTSIPISGFQLAVMHDPLVLTPVAGSDGSALTFDPVISAANLAPLGAAGVVVGVAFPFFPTTTTIGPAIDAEIYVITYDVVPGAPLGDTTIALVDGLVGSPTVDNAISDSTGASIFPNTLTAGVVEILAGPDFIRGDCDGDGTYALGDVITTLAVLFSGQTPSCEKACDTNDDGLFSLIDAIDLLGFLFGGAMLPDPASTCGPDPGADLLSCDSVPGCP